MFDESVAVTRKVLCVDDEPNLLRATQRQLRHHFEVFTAESGAAGLDLLASEGPFAVVVSDFNMPGMNGAEFLGQVRAAQPDAVTIMLTGRAELDVVVAALHHGRLFRFLTKPCPPEVLLEAIREGWEQYRLVRTEQTLSARLRTANEALQNLNSGLEQRVAERTGTIRMLNDFLAELNGQDSLENVAQLIVSAVARHCSCQRAALLVPDGESGALRVVAVSGVEPTDWASWRIPQGTAVSGEVFALGGTVFGDGGAGSADHVHPADAAFFGEQPHASIVLAAPEGPVGVLNLVGGQPGWLDSSLWVLKAVAEVSAIALHNQLRRGERDEARDAVILALAKLAEHRDPETGAHLERVQIYCRLLAETLRTRPAYATEIDAEFIENIVRSSPLHDIGKVGIPDRILLKPGRLTPEEYEIMKSHARIGGDTIRSLMERRRAQGFLHMGMLIALHHHEKFDGTGYPSRLAGQGIPLPARILAVADVYDALTSHRVYKPAMPHEKAMSIITTDSGRHFDPDVVEVLCRRATDFAETCARLADQTGEPEDGLEDHSTPNGGQRSAVPALL